MKCLKTLIFGWLKLCVSMWASWSNHLLCIVCLHINFIYLFILTANKHRSILKAVFEINFTARITNIHLGQTDNLTCKTRSNLQNKNTCLKIRSTTTTLALRKYMLSLTTHWIKKTKHNNKKEHYVNDKISSFIIKKTVLKKYSNLPQHDFVFLYLCIVIYLWNKKNMPKKSRAARIIRK